MTINVYWAVADQLKDFAPHRNTGIHGAEITQEPPERAITYFKNGMFKDNPPLENYSICPGYQNYFKNTFVIKSCIDYNMTMVHDNDMYQFSHDLKNETEMSFDVMSGDMVSPNINNPIPIVQQRNSIILFADKPVTMEQTPADLDINEFTMNTTFLPGSVDISKWFRPIHPAFIIHQYNKNIHVKLGDAVYYLKFLTDEKVNMHRFMMNDRLQELSCSCLHAKKYKLRIPLKKLYDSFTGNGFDKMVLREIKKNLL